MSISHENEKNPGPVSTSLHHVLPTQSENNQCKCVAERISLFRLVIGVSGPQHVLRGFVSSSEVKYVKSLFIVQLVHLFFLLQCLILEVLVLINLNAGSELTERQVLLITRMTDRPPTIPASLCAEDHSETAAVT